MAEKHVFLTMLVRDLMKDRDLRQQFNRDPEQVMGDYILSNEERHVLYGMDPDVLEQRLFEPVADDVKNFSIPDGEFGPEGPNCIEDPGVTKTEYPTPTPALFRVRPRILNKRDLLTVGEDSDTPTHFVEFVVYGQTFSRDPAPDISVVNVDDSSDALADMTTNLFGTMRCSQLRVLAPVKGDESATYEITLTNSPTSASPTVIKNKLRLGIDLTV